MKVTITGEFLSAEPTRSGKGVMVGVLQDSASCELYASNERGFQWPSRMEPVVIEAIIRDGFEGRGFSAHIQSIEKAAAKPKAVGQTS